MTKCWFKFRKIRWDPYFYPRALFRSLPLRPAARNSYSALFKVEQRAITVHYMQDLDNQILHRSPIIHNQIF